MEEGTYVMIFVVLIALLVVCICMIGLLLAQGATSSQVKSGFSGVNRNVSSIKTSTLNSINTTFAPISASLSNTVNSISPTISNAVAGLPKADNANITSAASGVNKNISSLGSTFSTAISNSYPQGRLENISINTSETIKLLKQLNQSFQQTTGIGWLSLPLHSQNISTANYVVGQLQDGFANRVNYTGSNTFNISVLTLAQYQNFTQGRTYSTVSFYQSSGSQNDIFFYFNRSEGCDQYIYIVQLFEQNEYTHSSDSNTLVDPNVSIKFQPSASRQGVC